MKVQGSNVFILISHKMTMYVKIGYHLVLSPMTANMPEGPDVEIGGGGSEGQQGLHRCDNPWKPNAQHGQSEVMYGPRSC